MKKVTILINSCDSYSECWKGWIHGFKKYWADCPWDVMFMSNYLNASIGKSSKTGSNTNWTYMMKKTLEQIKTPYVLLTVDDAWITDYINTNNLLEFINVMERDNITHLRLIPAKDGIENYPKDDRLKIVKKDSIYRTSITSALWNKEHLYSFLKDNENMWEFETNGRYREKGNYLILFTKEWHFPCIRQDNPNPLWKESCVVQQGEWYSGAKKYAEIEKLDIDLSIHPKDKLKKKGIKILWLYEYLKQYNYDHWFHMDFANAINNYEGVELKSYGWGLDEMYSSLSIPYNKNKLLSDVKKEFDFDVIISNSKSRMFKEYYPPMIYEKERRIDCWLPADFGSWNKTPKIALEEDYHYERDDSWYVENNIDLMLQRHYSQSCRKENIKKLWLPFSVDVNVFKPDNRKRINKICNAGSYSNHVYPHRCGVMQAIIPSGYLIIRDRDSLLKGYDYPECLKSYSSHISSSSIYNITPAKMFEIMASGSLLFTNESDKYGLADLFPENAYCTYKEDYSDAIVKTKKIIEDKEYREETVKKAIKYIKQRHSNEVRIGQLLRIIKNEFKIEV